MLKTRNTLNINSTYCKLKQYKQKRIARHLSSATFENNSDSKTNDESVLPEKAKVVIAGGGVMGASVAYHLAEIGWGPNTVVLDQSELGSGLTWYSNGVINLFKSSRPQTKMCDSTLKLYLDLVDKGCDIGWNQSGSISLARTVDRMTMFKKMKAQSASWEINCDIISPERIKQLCPLVEVNDLKGGFWVRDDATADPYKICLTLFDIAKKNGVQVFEKCKVKQVFSKSGRVAAVETPKGAIECEYFVNCGGCWARRIGHSSKPKVKIPVHPVEYHYLLTKPVPDLDHKIPTILDLDGHVYLREYQGCALAGGYEPSAKPLFSEDHIPENFQTSLMSEDWDHFHILLEELLHRVPSLGDISVSQLINCPETFSPDGKWIMGEAPEIKNYFVASGMKTVGIAAAGGVGKIIADWIVNEAPHDDLYELDIMRFLSLHDNPKFLQDRLTEVPGLYFAVAYPYTEFETGRNLRMSPIYPKLKEKGGIFGQVMGYERPNWFDVGFPRRSHEVGDTPFTLGKTHTFYKPDWFDVVKNEYMACREAVGLIDYSSYTKIDIWSNDDEVVHALQYLCSNDVDVDVNEIIHTGLQNIRGGYENDCSLVRMSENSYMMIAPTIQQTRCKAWLDRHLPKDGSVKYSDVTSMFTAICIVGPFSRMLLSELTETDLSPQSFPFFSHKEIEVGLVNGIRTMNITHTGELGYVLYIPNEFALHVYNCIVENGEKYGLKHVGYYAMRALRVEKFFAFWGQDLDTTTTPLECGRAWRVKFDKGIDFIGRDALLKQRKEGVKRMYVQLLLSEHDAEIDPWCCGNEPIYRDDVYVGDVTTTSYGFTVKQQVCLGFVQNLEPTTRVPQTVTNEYVLSGRYEVDVGGLRFPAKVNLHSPILPTKYPDKERESYLATRDINKQEPILRDS